MKKPLFFVLHFSFFILALALCGCANYQWTSDVPERMRTVSVPTFRNESDTFEAGVMASTQLLREFQREGTFQIREVGDAAVEVQGTVLALSPTVTGYNRRSLNRIISGTVQVIALVTVVDKTRGRIVINNKMYTGDAEYSTNGDYATAYKSASIHALDDLATKVVDDVLTLQW